MRLINDKIQNKKLHFVDPLLPQKHSIVVKGEDLSAEFNQA